jgi:hypothetical protein
LVELEQKATEQTKPKIESIRQGLLDDPQRLDLLLEVEYHGLSQLQGHSLDTKLEMALDSYRRMAGEQPAKIWEAKKQGITEDEEKRGFIRRLICDTFKIYLSIGTIEKIKLKLLNISFFSAVGITVLLAAIVHSNNKVVIWMLLLAGLWGAFLSIFQRISSIDTSAANFRSFISLIHAPLGLLVSMGVGMLFPVIALILISSGTLRGTFLPRVDALGDVMLPYAAYSTNYSIASQQDYLEHIAELNRTDSTNKTIQKIPAEDLEHFSTLNFDRNFAKLLLLAFFCGFSERFVKDAVDAVARRIAKQANTNDPLDSKT